MRTCLRSQRSPTSYVVTITGEVRPIACRPPGPARGWVSCYQDTYSQPERFARRLYSTPRLFGFLPPRQGLEPALAAEGAKAPQTYFLCGSGTIDEVARKSLGLKYRVSSLKEQQHSRNLLWPFLIWLLATLSEGGRAYERRAMSQRGATSSHLRT